MQKACPFELGSDLVMSAPDLLVTFMLWLEIYRPA